MDNFDMLSMLFVLSGLSFHWKFYRNSIFYDNNGHEDPIIEIVPSFTVFYFPANSLYYQKSVDMSFSVTSNLK